MRVPTPAVSAVDFSFEVSSPVTVADINSALKSASEGPLKGILGYSELPLVSKDYLGNQLSSVIDALSTMVIDGTMAKVVSWFDNEWGYSNRVVDLTAYMARLSPLSL